MPSTTPYFQLAIFDFGDDLTIPLNVQKETDRFLIIDKQLFGLYNIFGNGVISGWTVAAEDTTSASGISISISEGIGIVNFIAAETTFPDIIGNLPPNATFDIYATFRGSTFVDRIVEFTLSFVDISSEFALKLATVTTGANAVKTIDNSVRTLISFQQIIKEEIDAHKHRGTPTKIDLAEETKNQLPGARLEGIDASKVTSGAFDIDRIPIVDHNDLDNDGLLTHAQLDSFVKTLTQNNKELLGEVTSVNVLKQIIFLKYKFADVDKHFINELALIPGISPDAFIDFENSTANINLGQQCISGLPPSVGEFISIFFDDQRSFVNAFKRTNLDVFNDQVTLARDQTALDTVEDFENVRSGGAGVPGFAKTTEIITDKLSLTAEGGDTLRSEGFFSGKFKANRKFRAVFTKTFDSARDWTTFDQLIVNIKTLSTSHPSVSAFFISTDDDGNELESTNFVLLERDAITENPEVGKNDFEKKTFSIDSETRDKVTKLIIFIEETDEKFEFFIDDIFVRNENLFVSQGTIQFRFSNATPVTFHSVFYDIDTPENTEIQVRIRVASSPTLLPRSAFTLPFISGQVLGLDGADAEVEVTFLTEDVKVTPVLKSLELRLLTAADFHGFDVKSVLDWKLGDPQNITIKSDLSGQLPSVIISNPINVGGLVYTNKDAVSEVDDERVGIHGFSGNNLPVSPEQAIRFGQDQTKGFDGAVSVVRMFDKRFLVADNKNNRVLEFNSDGELLRGFGSVRSSDEDFYPFSSVYNPTSGIITIVFSKGIDKESVDLEKISLFIGTAEIPLTSADSVVDTKSDDRILAIHLSSSKFNQLIGVKSNVTINFKNGAFAETIQLNENASELIGSLGIEVFIGNFTYIDHIRHPVFVNILENGNWVVANSSIFSNAATIVDTGTDDVSSAALVEFDPDNPDIAIFGYDDLTFSDFSLGSIIEQTSDRLAIAGIFKSDGAVTQVVDIADSSDTTTVQRTIFLENREDGELRNASSVELSSVDGTFGIQRDDTGDSVVADSTAVHNPSTGKYEFVFDAEVGATYTASWEIVPTVGAAAIFQTETFTGAADSGVAFNAAAVVAHAGFRGIVTIIDKSTSNKILQYTSPDGLFPSDVDIDNDGNLLVAETDFGANSGRIITLDSFGNIINQIGQGSFRVINNAKSLLNGNILVSI